MKKCNLHPLYKLNLKDICLVKRKQKKKKKEDQWNTIYIDQTNVLQFEIQTKPWGMVATWPITRGKKVYNIYKIQIT